MEDSQDKSQETPYQQDEGYFARLYDAHTAKGSEGVSAQAPINRQTVTFTVDSDICASTALDKDFELTIGSLTSAMELKATERAKNNPTALAYEMTKESIISMDGHRLVKSRREVDVLWEALGQKGRNLVMGMFSQIGAPDDAALGKAQSTLKIS